MDLRQYYRKVREVEGTLREPYVMVSSTETSDGGKPGVVSEVKRELAASLIVSSKAVLANPGEVEAYRTAQEEAKDAHEKAELSKRLQVAIITDPDGKLAPRKQTSK